MFHHVLSITICVPWRQNATITTRLHTSNNHLAGSLTFRFVPFRHVLLRVCDFAFHPRTKIYYGFTFTLPFRVPLRFYVHFAVSSSFRHVVTEITTACFTTLHNEVRSGGPPMPIRCAYFPPSFCPWFPLIF